MKNAKTLKEAINDAFLIIKKGKFTVNTEICTGSYGEKDLEKIEDFIEEEMYSIKEISEDDFDELFYQEFDDDYVNYEKKELVKGILNSLARKGMDNFPDLNKKVYETVSVHVCF